MPYLIVAHYHETNTVTNNNINIENKFGYINKALWITLMSEKSILQYSEGEPSEESQVRGIGTDVGIVSCMVFLAQFILSLTMVSLLWDYMIELWFRLLDLKRIVVSITNIHFIVLGIYYCSFSLDNCRCNCCICAKFLWSDFCLFCDIFRSVDVRNRIIVNNNNGSHD